MEPARWEKARGSAEIPDSADVTRSVKTLVAAKGGAVFKALARVLGQEVRRHGIR